jgi:hypothetical protein
MMYWFNDKCQSLNIEMNLVNKKLNLYQMKQIAKIKLDVDNYFQE